MKLISTLSPDFHCPRILIKGATIKAEDSLAINTTNLEVSSVQDSSKTRSNSMGISAGYGGGSLSSLGANMSNANSKSKQTVLTSLTGNKVDINTEQETKLRGATIAAVDADGKDNGNLNLKTDTLLASSLNNTHNSKSMSVGINVGGAVEDAKISNVGLDYSNDRTNSKTKTLATLGNGNIQIADKENSETRMLNTDVANNEVDIYNISSHKGLKVELDTRLLTEDGRASIANDAKIAAKHINDAPIVGKTLTYQTKDGQEILVEDGKLYKYNSDGKKEELAKGNYVVYKSGMLDTADDTQVGYKELTDGTTLKNYENVILVNNPTHAFGIADGLESLIGYIGIPTGNAFQTQDFNEAANELGTIVNLTYSQANIVEKNSNRLHYGEPLSNIYTYSIGSPEYAGKDEGQGNTLDNASQGAGANFMGGFNNPKDPVSLLGLNNRESALNQPKNNQKESIKDFLDAADAGHSVNQYNQFFKDEKVDNTIRTLLDIEK